MRRGPTGRRITCPLCARKVVLTRARQPSMSIASPEEIDAALAAYVPKVGDLATWTETHTKRVEAVLSNGMVRLRNDPNEYAVTKPASILRPTPKGGPAEPEDESEPSYLPVAGAWGTQWRAFDDDEFPRLGWEEEMMECIGRPGRVVDVDSDGDVLVRHDNAQWYWPPQTLRAHVAGGTPVPGGPST